ncbi:hypothetical protein K490DRAFT_62978 [Saccharata proteae CBS 121410]|uniref:Zinc-binding loop region of homing endonuclease domain-containing protein n=1 Tax=Saccharata proteae CBS 121410 TaxID=1314787 RepID=A0A9P4LX05_9PEZI|nr:hypothetical protein K490DRAFT_62978 [Saccharata proteae CBS 121410]
MSQTSGSQKTDLCVSERGIDDWLYSSSTSQEIVEAISSPQASKEAKTPGQSSKISSPSKRALAIEATRARKEYLMYEMSTNDKTRIQNRVNKFLDLLGPQVEEDECWLHPDPSKYPKNQSVSVSAYLKDLRGSGQKIINVHIGTLIMLLDDNMTTEQKTGYINDKWELSHLCGNWLCCNTRHHVQESHKINVGRKPCHARRQVCFHEPKCILGRQVKDKLEAGQTRLNSWPKKTNLTDTGAKMSESNSATFPMTMEKCAAAAESTSWKATPTLEKTPEHDDDVPEVVEDSSLTATPTLKDEPEHDDAFTKTMKNASAVAIVTEWVAERSDTSLSSSVKALMARWYPPTPSQELKRGRHQHYDRERKEQIDARRQKKRARRLAADRQRRRLTDIYDPQTKEYPAAPPWYVPRWPRLKDRKGKPRRQDTFSHIQVVTRHDTTAYDNTTLSFGAPSFKHIATDVEVASLRSSSTTSTSHSTTVAESGHTFAEMTKAQARYQAPPASRPTTLGTGLLKLKPKPKSRARNWHALDLSDVDSHDSPPGSPAPIGPTSSQRYKPNGRDTASGQKGRQARPETPDSTEQIGSMDEIVDVFGGRLPDPIFLRAQTGENHGDIQYIQHPNWDVSAHQWSETSFEWLELGRYSCSRKLINGFITPVKTLTVARPHARPHSLRYFCELAEEHEQVLKTQPLTAFKTEETPVQPHSHMDEPWIHQQDQQERPKFPFGSVSHEPNRYDSLSTASGASTQDTGFPTLGSLSQKGPSSYTKAKPSQQQSRQISTFSDLESLTEEPFERLPHSSRIQLPWREKAGQQPVHQSNNHFSGIMDMHYNFPLKDDVAKMPGMPVLRSFLVDANDDQEQSPTTMRRRPVVPQETQRVRDMTWPTKEKVNTNAADSGPFPQHFPELHEPTPTRDQIPEYLSKLMESERRADLSPVQLPYRVTGPVAQNTPASTNQSSTSTVVQSQFTFHFPYNGSATPMMGGVHQPQAHRLTPSSTSLVTNGEPEPGYEDRLVSIYKPPGDVIPPTKQDFNGAFFQDIEEPTNPYRGMSAEERLDKWWTSGLMTQRHDDWTKTLHMPAPPGLSHPYNIGASRLLLPLYETFEAYVHGGKDRHRYDYFARFGPPPEWCIDKSAKRNDSMFGEDWGEPPKRIGRDPRYRPTFHKPRYTVFEDQEVWWNNSRSKYDRFRGE